MHSLDQALQKALPTLGVPRFGRFLPLAQPGQRLLIAVNGFFLEVRRDWLYAVQPCGTMTAGLRLPFGELVPQIDLRFGKVPRPLLSDFVQQARLAWPAEAAAVAVYRAADNRLELRPCESLSASPVHLRYRMPELADGEQIAIDLHSHGEGAAGFSAQDDVDDQGATKIAIVVGRVRSCCPEVAVRLCLNGLFVPLAAPACTSTDME